MESAFGSALGSGDVNGDGYSDLFIGEPNGFSAPCANGCVHVYYGKASGMVTDDLDVLGQSFTVSRRTALGAHLAPAGDLNHDGFDDVLISESRNPPFVASLYFGSATGLSTADAGSITQPGAPVALGGATLAVVSLASAADLDGDGNADALVVVDPGLTIADVTGRLFLSTSWSTAAVTFQQSAALRPVCIAGAP
jgi:hypothetical protein